MIFLQRFRMDKHLFWCIFKDIMEVCSYFQQCANARCIFYCTLLQKCMVSLRQLAYVTLGYLDVPHNKAFKILLVFHEIAWSMIFSQT